MNGVNVKRGWLGWRRCAWRIRAYFFGSLVKLGSHRLRTAELWVQLPYESTIFDRLGSHYIPQVEGNCSMAKCWVVIHNPQLGLNHKMHESTMWLRPCKRHRWARIIYPLKLHDWSNSQWGRHKGNVCLNQTSCEFQPFRWVRTPNWQREMAQNLRSVGSNPTAPTIFEFVLWQGMAYLRLR